MNIPNSPEDTWFPHLSYPPFDNTSFQQMVFNTNNFKISSVKRQLTQNMKPCRCEPTSLSVIRSIVLCLHISPRLWSHDANDWRLWMHWNSYASLGKLPHQIASRGNHRTTTAEGDGVVIDSAINPIQTIHHCPWSCMDCFLEIQK